MPRSSPSFAATEGGQLIAFSCAALAAICLANVAPPARWWWPALAVAAGTAAFYGLRRWPAAGWWVLAGACAGALAGALAPRAPDDADGAVPVRFRLTIADGWQSGQHGWSVRVSVGAVSGPDGPLACPHDLWLSLGGDAALAALPIPGSQWEGSGELAYRRGWPLARPQLRVKSLLLLRPLPGAGAIDSLRERCMQALLRAAGVDPPRLRAAGLAAALVLGRTDRLSGGEVDELRRSGLAHLLAVSGLNVGLVGAFVWAVLLGAGVGPARRRWIVAIAMLAFAALAGWGAPVRRAAFGGAGYLVARQLGRPLLALPVVWAIVAALALAEPDAVLQASFQLSAIVTLALVRWVEPVARRLAVLPRWAAAAVAVALVGQMTSSPLVGQHFGTLSLLGVAANLVAAPVAFVLTVLGLVALLVALASGTLGGVALACVGWLQVVLDAISRAATTGVLEFPAMPALLLAAMSVLGACGLTRVRPAALTALAAVALWCGWVAAPRLGPRRGGEVRMLGVGEGMALLVRDGVSAVLVDAGRSPAQAGRALAAQRVRALAALVLTHHDADHLGGAARVLERVRVGALVFPANVTRERGVVSLRRMARRRGVAEVPVAAGQRVVLGRVACDVLWPDGPGRPAGNDGSLVAVLRVAGESVLVTGDLEAAGEAAFLAAAPPPRAALLQLPHHGSATSSTTPFLAAVRPTLALAASGLRPRYPYPALAVAARVRALPALLLAQTAGATVVSWQVRGSGYEVDGRVRVPARSGER